MTVFAIADVNLQAQTPATLGPAIVVEGFDVWTGTTPNNWMIAPATNISPANVTKAITTNTLYPVYGAAACNLVNTTALFSTAVMAGNPVAVTAGMGYQVSYYARGKGNITVGVTNGGSVTAAIATGQTVDSKLWHHFYQTVIAPTTTNNAQFALEVKNTGTYTNGFTITGIDVDSFKVQPYTPIASASLYALQYTTLANGNSPFYAQYVSQIGGIVTDVMPNSSGSYNYYYIQTSGSNKWAASIVFDPIHAPNVAIGDSLTFRCAIDEYFGMTELVQVNNFVKVSSGNPIPTPVTLTTQTVNQEMYESLLVNVQAATVQTYNVGYGQGSAMDISGGSATIDFESGFYPPNGTANGSTSNPGYQPTISNVYCITGNVYYEFNAFNIVPRDSADITTNCTAGIDKYNSLKANVYPNPMTNSLTIQLPFIAQKVNVTLIDILGNEVFSYTTSDSRVNLNNINLPAGVYTVKIVADGKTQIVKVIHQ